jgi:uncharacterized protein YfkK (UPF0435 family)
MSYRSTADENLDKAVDSIKDAIKLLSTIVLDEAEGYSDFNEEYRDKVYKSMTDLIEIKSRLDR